MSATEFTAVATLQRGAATELTQLAAPLGAFCPPPDFAALVMRAIDAYKKAELARLDEPGGGKVADNALQRIALVKRTQALAGTVSRSRLLACAVLFEPQPEPERNRCSAWYAEVLYRPGVGLALLPPHSRHPCIATVVHSSAEPSGHVQ